MEVFSEMKAYLKTISRGPPNRKGRWRWLNWLPLCLWIEVLKHS
jgi:hypothetical protein